MSKDKIQKKINELQEILNSNLTTEYNIILDRSGSMSSIKDDMEGGFKTWLETEKQLPGEAVVNLYQFDDKFETVYENQTLENAKLDLAPRGMTALHDAIGKTIGLVKDRHKKNKPDRTQFLIITDGHENSSREWTGEKVKELVELETSKNDWMFLYIGANQDAILKGQELGIRKGSSLNFASDEVGTSVMWSNYIHVASGLRCSNNETYRNYLTGDQDVFDPTNQGE